MVFKEINTNEDVWTYEKVGDFIEGFLTKIQSDVGVNKSKMYSIETTTGVKNVWGSVVLDQKISLVKIGDKIRITYKGLTESSKGKKPAKMFKVEVDEDMPKEDDEMYY